MFLAKYLKYSFDFKHVFEHIHEKTWKVIIYFMILSFIAIFPSNYKIIVEQGWRLDFIEESFMAETPNWNLPDNCTIIGGTFNCDTNIEYVLKHREITFVFNAQEGRDALNQKAILFYKDYIVYQNADGHYMTGSGYKGFSEPLSFREINLMSNEDKASAYQSFGQQIEASFGNYIVLYSVLVNTVTTFGTYILYLILLGLILQLFRFGYSKFMSYKESLKFLVFLMGVPALVGFVVGMIEPAFGVVLFQFSMGIIAMLVMLFYGKKVFA